MPKIKTNRLAYKKFRVSGKGKAIKHARARTSHNTGKKPAKRMRQLRGNTGIDSTNERLVRGMLPYSK